MVTQEFLDFMQDHIAILNVQVVEAMRQIRETTEILKTNQIYITGGYIDVMDNKYEWSIQKGKWQFLINDKPYGETNRFLRIKLARLIPLILASIKKGVEMF